MQKSAPNSSPQIISLPALVMQTTSGCAISASIGLEAIKDSEGYHAFALKEWSFHKWFPL
jgi:hypothetical protein